MHHVHHTLDKKQHGYSAEDVAAEICALLASQPAPVTAQEQADIDAGKLGPAAFSDQLLVPTKPTCAARALSSATCFYETTKDAKLAQQVPGGCGANNTTGRTTVGDGTSVCSDAVIALGNPQPAQGAPHFSVITTQVHASGKDDTHADMLTFNCAMQPNGAMRATGVTQQECTKAWAAGVSTVGLESLVAKVCQPKGTS